MTQQASVPQLPPSPGLEAEIKQAREERWDPERLIEWGLERFAPRISLSASFGSPEGMVILDMMHRIDPSKTRVFTIDTGRLAQPTYNLIDRVRDRYDLEVEIYFPNPERVQAMVREHGMNLFYESIENRRMCCSIRKVEPLQRALIHLDAWIAGLRREQGVTRTDAEVVELDTVHGDRIKLNPLAYWTRDEVWSYVERHGVPVNSLHAKGYPSVGCLPCSRAITDGEDERAGRWWWEQAETRECGIHSGESEGSGI
ncbi:MAG: phosphoadenylyl-sulfate reductase [Myxococcota bacterium]